MHKPSAVLRGTAPALNRCCYFFVRANCDGKALTLVLTATAPPYQYQHTSHQQHSAPAVTTATSERSSSSTTAAVAATRAQNACATRSNRCVCLTSLTSVYSTTASSSAASSRLCRPTPNPSTPFTTHAPAAATQAAADAENYSLLSSSTSSSSSATTTSTTTWSPAARELVGGVLAGAVNVTSGYPFDTMKVRLQAHSSRGSLSMAECFWSIWRTEGVSEWLCVGVGV